MALGHDNAVERYRFIVSDGPTAWMPVRNGRLCPVLRAGLAGGPSGACG